nr:MaoC/PaaZ C-terminal domain-containing protein [uncultured Helicobacter sp.]
MPKITQTQLLDFANLSGDFNPVHLDENFAKNSYFGEQILYGIYQVFYTLEVHCKKYPTHILHSLKATFLAPVGVKNHFSLKSLDSKLSHNAGGGGGEPTLLKKAMVFLSKVK